MSQLLDILQADREAICQAFARRVDRGDCPALGQTADAGCRAILDALAASGQDANETAVRVWARGLNDQAAALGLSFGGVLAGLTCLEGAIRAHFLKNIGDRREAASALAGLGRQLDLLRRCYGEALAGETERAAAPQHVFAALVEQSGDLVCLADLHGKPFYLNRAARRAIGLEEGESLETLRLHQLHCEETWAELRDVAVPAVKQHGHWEGPSRIRNLKTGRLTDVQTTMFLVRQPQTERATCLAIVHRQCGDRRRVEQALAESQARKHAILESALDPIITIDSRGVVTEFNRAAEQVFGHPRAKVLGTEPSEILFPPSKSAGHHNRIERYLEVGEGSLLGKRIEVTAVRANGETFPAEMAMTISQEQGSPVLTFFVRDISARKRAEEEQARYAAELERSNSELEQYAYVASHDLQEPLRKIRTFGDRLEVRCGQALDETGRECLTRMQDAAERMQALINGLLTLSRVTTKGQNFVTVDLAHVAGEVVADLEVQIEHVEGRVEVGRLPTIQADAFQMRQLLQNLIGNALKFHRPDETPVVKVEGRFVKGRGQRAVGGADDEEQCRIVVEDNGIGFEEKYLDRIFGVFQRLHPRDVYQGTGVGLAICRKIVERHGGTITAQSQPGAGSTFVALLPVFHRQQKS